MNVISWLLCIYDHDGWCWCTRKENDLKKGGMVFNWWSGRHGTRVGPADPKDWWWIPWGVKAKIDKATTVWWWIPWGVKAKIDKATMYRWWIPWGVKGKIDKATMAWWWIPWGVKAKIDKTTMYRWWIPWGVKATMYEASYYEQVPKTDAYHCQSNTTLRGYPKGKEKEKF